MVDDFASGCYGDHSGMRRGRGSGSPHRSPAVAIPRRVVLGGVHSRTGVLRHRVTPVARQDWSPVPSRIANRSVPRASTADCNDDGQCEESQCPSFGRPYFPSTSAATRSARPRRGLNAPQPGDLIPRVRCRSCSSRTITVRLNAPHPGDLTFRSSGDPSIPTLGIPACLNAPQPGDLIPCVLLRRLRPVSEFLVSMPLNRATLFPECAVVMPACVHQRRVSMSLIRATIFPVPAPLSPRDQREVSQCPSSGRQYSLEMRTFVDFDHEPLCLNAPHPGDNIPCMATGR
jgi:hypothetical protein